MNRRLKMIETILEIEQWAKDRNIIQGATVHAQMLKLAEEHGELAAAIARGQRGRIEDGIGDMIVVLTILAAQHGLTLGECAYSAYLEIKDRNGRMVDGVFIKEADL